MADSLPWSCRRGDSSQVEREIVLEGSHKTPLIFRANSAKIMAFLSFWDWPPSIFNCKIRDFYFFLRQQN